MTLATSGAPETASCETATDEATLKTAFDCDIITLTRDAHAHALGAKRNARQSIDPLDALYRPLGSKDVQGALCTKASRA